MTKASNHKLKIAREERRKKEENVEKRKTKALTIKRRKDRRGLSLFNEKEGNYKSDNEDDTDLDQANDKYPLQY